MSYNSYDAESNPENYLPAESPDTSWIINKGCYKASAAFPQFMRFPPELRNQIWHFYCPDLSVKARVLPFLGNPTSKVVDYNTVRAITDNEILAEQTERLRAVLSTHRESRSIAVRKYPDELLMETAAGASIIRFRKETDVIFLSVVRTGEDYSISEFGIEIENLAVDFLTDYSGERYHGRFYGDRQLLQVVTEIKSLFPNLKRLFSSRLPMAPKHKDMDEWCVTEHVHSYMVESHQRHQTTTFYWPDLDSHADFARSSVPKLCSLEEMHEAGVEFWPMVEFKTWNLIDSCIQKFYQALSSAPSSAPSNADSNADSSNFIIAPYYDSSGNSTDSDKWNRLNQWIDQ
ncbi:hypothetical protein E4U56_003345 [Claviceps arundinis]|uniref:2EXR domain-containing protein n=1 Tax=Claviceps arundinis TaxID=1623583 RepID=A0A9P7MZW5_9HYPO|nr:hypothetical protein E4U56_003345 [Claviceps arundinis]